MNRFMWSPLVEAKVLVGPGVGVVGDHAEPVHFQPRSDPVEKGGLDDRSEHHLLVDHLLHLVEDLLADARVHLLRLLAVEPVHLRIGPVDTAYCSSRVGALPGAPLPLKMRPRSFLSPYSWKKA